MKLDRNDKKNQSDLTLSYHNKSITWVIYVEWPNKK